MKCVQKLENESDKEPKRQVNTFFMLYLFKILAGLPTVLGGIFHISLVFVGNVLIVCWHTQ